MKKIIIGLITLILISITTYSYGSSIIKTITNNNQHEIITITSGQAIVFSFPKQIENITFSKDSGFTIRTLEGGIWKDLSSNIYDYSPITGILARNISEGDLIIDVTYKSIISPENTLFQKTLKAGWNLVGPAYKDDQNGLVSLINAFGDISFSHIVDFTTDGLLKNVYSGETRFLAKDTYSEEATINSFRIYDSANYNGNTNYVINGNLNIKNKDELSEYNFLESLAYGIFVSNETVMPGSQRTEEDIIETPTIITIECDEISQLLGLCSSEIVIETQCNEINQLLGFCTITTPVCDEISQLLGLCTSQTPVETQCNEVNQLLGICGTTTIINQCDEISNLLGLCEINETPICDEVSSLLGLCASTTPVCDEISQLLGLCDNEVIEEILAPTNLHITQTGATQIGFAWDNVENTSSYNVNYSTDEISVILGLGNKIEGITSTGTTIVSLTPETTYYFGVQAVAQDGTVSHTITPIQTTTTACDEVSELLGVCGELTELEINELNTLLGTNSTKDELMALTNITLYDKNLTEIPSGIFKLTNLTFLRISNNQITSIPSKISNLINLWGLALSSNQISSIPIEITNLTNLNNLDLRTNQITLIPNEISNLTNLEVLYLSENQINSIPIEVTNLPNLTSIYINTNQISSIPIEIINLTKLINFDLSFNQINTLPNEITNLTKLINFDLRANQNLNELSNSFNNENKYKKCQNNITENNKRMCIDSTGDKIIISVMDNIIGGTLSLTADTNNIDNQDAKTILAGTEQIIYSVDVLATNEEVNVENIYFTFDTDLKNVINSAKLYLNDTVVATASNSDVNSYGTGILAFDNISNLNFPTNSAELKLAITTESIGFEKIGIPVSNISVTKVVLNNVNGVNSADSIAVGDLTNTASNTFDVVPTIVVTSNSNLFGTDDSIATLTFAVDSGINTDPVGNDLFANLSKVTINVTSLTSSGIITVRNSTNDIIASGALTNNDDLILTTNDVISNGETYTFETDANATYEVNNIEYVVENNTYTINLINNINLGTYESLIVITPGTLTLTADTNNIDNQDAKTILAGTEQNIYSVDTKATNEAVKANTVIFTLDTNLKEVVSSAKLYLDNILVATASSVDVSNEVNSTITFDNINTLEIPTFSSELKLAINTYNIGYQEIGIPVSNVSVTNVSIPNATGVNSNTIVTVSDLTTTASNTFDVVPTTVVTSTSDTFGNTDPTATLTFSVDSGNNTDSNGNILNIGLEILEFDISLLTSTGTVLLKNNIGETIATTSIINEGPITLNIIPGEIISNGEIYTITTDAKATYQLTNKGVQYIVDGITYTISLNNNISLGTYSNN